MDTQKEKPTLQNPQPPQTVIINQIVLAKKDVNQPSKLKSRIHQGRNISPTQTKILLSQYFQCQYLGHCLRYQIEIPICKYIGCISDWKNQKSV